MMSARQVFQRAFVHAQLSRPPDDRPFYLTEAQRDELPMDHQTLLTTLNWYGLEDEVGLFIIRNHPQLVAKINPALAAGLGPFNTRLKHGDEFTRNYVIKLAQTALDTIEKHNSQPEKKTETSAKEDRPQPSSQNTCRDRETPTTSTNPDKILRGQEC